MLNSVAKIFILFTINSTFLAQCAKQIHYPEGYAPSTTYTLGAEWRWQSTVCEHLCRQYLTSCQVGSSSQDELKHITNIHSIFKLRDTNILPVSRKTVNNDYYYYRSVCSNLELFPIGRQLRYTTFNDG